MENKLKNTIHPVPGPIKTLTVGDKVYQSVNDWTLSEREIKLSWDRFGESEEKKKKYLKEMKEKLSNEDFKYRMDDGFLLRFLRFRKYDFEKAYQNIKKFYNVRKQKPEYYKILPNLESQLDTNFYTYLPYLDEEGQILQWVAIGRWNLKKTSAEEILSSATCVYDIIVSNPKVQINGVTAIFDMAGATFYHLAEFLKKNRFMAYLNIVQDNMPWRLRKVLFVNTNSATRALYSIIRPLLNKKLADRFVVLGSDMKDLHEHVNPALLPKTLGGALSEEDCNITQQILKNLDYLKYERAMCLG